MPFFEFDDGRLVPAQFGHPVQDDFEPDLLEAVRAQVLEVVQRPLFPVSWHGDGRRPGTYRPTGAQPPRLTALDATGQVVTVEVVDELDSATLVAALSRSARNADLGWSQLAELYPRGLEAFRRDWNGFREMLPPKPAAGPRLVVVAGKVVDEVRPALHVLADSGVVVHEMSLRQMSNGRRFLQVDELRPHQLGVSMLTAGARLHELTADAVTPAETAAHVVASPESPADPAADGPQSLITSASAVTPGSAPAASAATPGSAAASAVTPGSAPAVSAATPGSAPAPSTSTATPASLGSTGDESPASPASATAETPGSAPSAGSAAEQDPGGSDGAPTFSDAAASVPAPGAPDAAAPGPADSAPQSAPATATDGLPGLADIAATLDGETPLVWAQLRRGIRHDAVLTTAGAIRLPSGEAVPDADDAARRVSGREDVDGWRVWRFGESGPSLADARAELVRARARAPRQRSTYARDHRRSSA